MKNQKPMTDEELSEFIAQKIAEKKAAAIARASKKITPEQGLYIKYRLKCMGMSSADIAFEIGCSKQNVCNVLSGKSHSQRIERAVASRLGYKSWNDMVTELRAMREMAA